MGQRAPRSHDFRSVIAERVSRRGVLLGSAGGLAAVAASGFVGSLFAGAAHAQGAQSSLTFRELKRICDQTHRVAEVYRADAVAAWGDPMRAGRGPFDARTLTAADRAERCG